jgi:uncharacterized protein
MAAPDHLILHGWQGSGLDHWQTWLFRRLRPAASFPGFPDPDFPHLEPWLETLRAALDRAAPAPTVVCHSLGCVLWLHYAAHRAETDPRAGRVLLVAPPCACSPTPELADFFPVPRDPDAVARAAEGETRLVCSDADPYCPEGAVRAYAEPLRIGAEVLDGAGHLNAEAGYGPWPEVEAWARGYADRLAGSGAKNGVET